ncbi:MAG: glycosyltransferase [Anaerovoracaceae bacterium]|jgi:glycosyltransferase involved in cell wall biosynthesis
MTKVLHIGYAHRFDDIRIFTKECLSLARNGYDVTFITSNKSTGSETPDDSDVRRIVLSLRGGRGIRAFRYFRDLKKYLGRTEYDIYHVHEMILYPVFKYLIKHGGTVIYDMHEDAPNQIGLDIARRVKFFGGAVRRYILHIDNKMIKNAAYNIIVVEGQRERAERFSSRVKMICNFPIIRDLELKHTDTNHICYAGGINESRGITKLVEAMPDINARLYLAGDGEKEYLDKLRSLDGWEKVDYLGFLDRESILDMYRKSSVGVFIAEPMPNIMKSYPIKLFEYMEAGLPVVCSDYDPWVEIVGKNNCGICVDREYSRKEFTDAVNGLLADRDRAAEMGKRGRATVAEKYSWNSQEKVLLEIYGELSDHNDA